MKRNLKFGLMALTLVGAPLGVGAVVLAQSSNPVGTAVNYASVFVEKLAATLGVDRAKLEAALKTAGTATVDEALKNQDITRNQAEALKSRIAGGELPFLGRGGQGGPGFGEPGFGGPGFGFRDGPRGPGMMGRGGFGPGGFGPGVDLRALPDAAAKALGITTDELIAQLRSGQSLSDLATSKNVDIKTVQAAVLAALKTQLDAAVKAGTITQARADALYQRAEADPNFGLRFGRGMGFRR